MKLISTTTLLVSIVMLAACAAQREAPAIAQPEPVDVAAQYDPQELQEIKLNAETVALKPAGTNSDSEVVCRQERRPGSHISEERCYTRAALRRQTDEAQDWLRTGGAGGSITEVFSGR